MRSVIILLGIVVVLALSGVRANACSCMGPPSPCEAYGSAAAVFVGTVTGVRQKERSTNSNEIDWTPVVVTFSVEQSYSGMPGTQVEVFTGRGGGDCGYQFQVGRRYLVYAYRNDRGLSTGICSRTRLFEAATEDLAFLGTLSSVAPGVTLSGEIRLEGIKGAFVSSDASITIESDWQRKEVRPDKDGNFRVTGVNPGKIKVSLKLPEKFTTDRSEREFSVSERGCAKLAWYVQDNGRISGRVVNAEGEPVPRIYVSLEDPANLERSAVTSERTNDDGQFSFSALAPGRYLIAVNRNRFPDPTDPTNAYSPTFYPGVIEATDARVITLGVGEKLTDFEVRIPSKQGASMIDGTVVLSDGSPVQHAFLKIKDITRGSEFYTLRTDNEGRFKINGYVGQKLIIEARSDLHRERLGQVTITLERPTERVRIEITNTP